MRGRPAAALTLCRSAVCLTAVCLSAAACTHTAEVSQGSLDPSGVFPNRAAAAPASLAPPAVAARTAVLLRYRRFHQVVERALATGDASQVPDVATGVEAGRLRDEIAADARAGIVRRGHAAPHPRAASVRAGSAVVVDCMAAAGPYTFRRDTGKRVGGVPAPRRYLLYATLSRAGGVWKVASIATPKDSRC
ncbi:hypothetical protein [Actinomadura harenae]|uniref:Lipoprotein n=1 Tax=Actinomadura harenae TaxID=2483351 RepID=A0A3M2LRP7_9ACTN|nr:hypothetical protein [Actinomadura harenae]RMI40119.1 hypothetical protein EBO15_27545 [Actinomadura harenae]